MVLRGPFQYKDVVLSVQECPLYWNAHLVTQLNKFRVLRKPFQYKYVVLSVQECPLYWNVHLVTQLNDQPCFTFQVTGLVVSGGISNTVVLDRP